MPKLIKLTKNLETIVDDDDFESLNKFKWYSLHCQYGYYAARSPYTKGNGQKTLLMHKVIMGDHDSFDIDHINGNKLDNRRENLRIVTRSQNMFNTPIRNVKKTSKYKGVVKKKNRWLSYIMIDYKQKFLGSYKEEKDAAMAYNKAVKEHFGNGYFINEI